MKAAAPWLDDPVSGQPAQQPMGTQHGSATEPWLNDTAVSQPQASATQSPTAASTAAPWQPAKTDMNTVPYDPAGQGDIGFNNDSQAQALPPGAQKWQIEMQRLISGGQVEPTPEGIKKAGRLVDAQLGTSFASGQWDEQKLALTAKAMAQGGVPGVITPHYQAPDISSARGQGGVAEHADAFARSAANVVPGADKIAALGDTLQGGDYHSNLNRELAVDDYDWQHHLPTVLAGTLAGGALIPGDAAGVASVAGRTAMREALVAGLPAEEARQVATRAALITSRNYAAKSGAVYGAASGAGNSQGIDEIPGHVVAGAAIGGATGAAIGQAGVKLLGGAPAADDAAVNAARAAGDLDISLPKFAMTDGGRANAGYLEQTAAGGPPIRAARSTMIDTAQAARDKIANDVGTPATGASADAVMGDNAQAAAVAGVRANRGRIGNIYNQASAAADNIPIPATQTAATLKGLVSEGDQVLGGTKAGAVFKNLSDDLAAKGGMLTIDGARATRTELRSKLINEAGVTPDNATRLTGHVMDALNSDISTGLRAAGKGDAVPLYKTADAQWAQQIETENDVLKPVLGPNMDAWGEDVAKRLNADVKGRGTRVAQFLSALPNDEANNVRATLIMHLGSAKNGVQNAAGDQFSLSTFLTNWNEIKGARNLIFPQATRDALNKLATVADFAKQAEASRNGSKTGGVLTRLLMQGGEIGGAAGIFTGHFKEAAASLLVTGLLAARQYGAAKLLANPDFARKLAATPLNPKGAQAFWGRPWVQAIAAKNPAIAVEINAFQHAVLNSANDNVVVGVQPAAAAAVRPEAAQESGQQQSQSAQP